MGFFDSVGNAVGSVTGGVLGGTAKGLAKNMIKPEDINVDTNIKDPNAASFQLGNANANRGQLANFGNQAAARQSAQINPNAGAADLANSANARAQQNAFAMQLAAQARGQGPSIAAAQAQAAGDQGLRQALAMAASARGVNPAAAQQMAMQQQSNIAGQVAGQSAIARLQEMNAAQGMLGQQLGQMRGADLQGAGMAQGLAAQQAALNNQMTGMNDAARQFSMSGQMGLDSTQLQANMTREGLLNQQGIAEMQGRLGQAEINKRSIDAYNQAMMGAAAGVVGGGLQAGMMALSDATAKENVKPADGKVQDFMRALSAKEYDYKKEANYGDGKKYVGVMAQDVEKSEMGKSIVKDTGGYKQLDVVRGFSMALAGLANLNKRLEKMEGNQ